MKWKIYSRIAKIVAGSVALSGVAFSGNAFADKVIYDSKKAKQQKKADLSDVPRKGAEQLGLAEGWKVTSTGGLQFIHPHDDNFWFNISGVIRLDQTQFLGNTADKANFTPSTGTPITNPFASGGNLRAADVYFNGGVGDNWEYSLQLQFAGGNGRVGFSDTYISYFGLIENNQIFVGNNSGNWFGLDNSNSTSWNPFLERSLPALAFYPGDGLGVMTDFWWDSGAITLVSMQPGPGVNSLAMLQDSSSTSPTVNSPTYGNRDRWTGVIRGTVAPRHEEGDVWHFGMSGAWKEFVSSYNGVSVPDSNGNGGGVAFGTHPSTKTRHSGSGTQLVRTPAIRVNNIRMFNVEAARQIGPFMLEAEYTNVFVHRIGGALGTLRFNGWNVQTRYLLTGESHAYDVRDGQFGTVVPNASCGAVELAARYDYINLNDKNVRGGTEHDVTVGVNWFLNQQLRLSANYIHASIHPMSDMPRRNLDIIGLRCQLRFK